MTTDRGPWTCRGSRMLAPLGSVVVGSFLSLGCLLVPGDEWVNLSLNIWDLHQKSRALHGPERERRVTCDICIHVHKDPSAKHSALSLHLHLDKNTLKPRIYPFTALEFFINPPLLSRSHTLHPEQIKTVNTQPLPAAPRIHKS